MFHYFLLKISGFHLKYILVKLSPNDTLWTCNDNLMSFNFDNESFHSGAKVQSMEFILVQRRLGATLTILLYISLQDFSAVFEMPLLFFSPLSHGQK